MLRVAIVDDQPIVRRGLSALLELVPDLTLVAAVAAPERLPWTGTGRITADVVVSDLFPATARPAVDAIRRMAQHVPVLVTSSSPDPLHALAAAHAGAAGYIMKNAAEETYLAGIRTVAAGTFYMSRQLADLVQEALPNSGAVPRGATLSMREQQALAYIAGGLTHQEAAARMGVSKATLDTYVTRVRTKLQLGNKAELALAALRYVDPQHRVVLDRAS